ncbi:MAG: orotate phosphoribosyltransferase [Acidimicrobiia bacterium]
MARAVRTDGPFSLRSGELSDWYLDGRQTTFDGEGGRLVGRCVLAVLDPTVTAVGGMTMGADPIAVATAVLADRPLKAFSIRKEAKDHGTGGRLVGPVGSGDRVAVVEDTVTTGGAMTEAVDVLRQSGIDVAQAIVVVDRSGGAAGRRLAGLDVPLVTLVTPSDLGVEA